MVPLCRGLPDAGPDRGHASVLWHIPEGNGAAALAASVDPFAEAPLMIGKQDGPQLRQLLRRILKRREHHRPLVEGQREQLHVVSDRALEPVGQIVSAVSTHESGKDP